MAAPAVAQVVLAGVVAGVGDSHQETSCQIGLVWQSRGVGLLTSEQLDVVPSPVRWNEGSVSVELSSFFVYFETSSVHTALYALTLLICSLEISYCWEGEITRNIIGYKYR